MIYNASMIRPATISDAAAIRELVNGYAERGLMLHRSLESIYESIRDFLVCKDGGGICGCVAVSVFWRDLAEVRSLAVADGHRGAGVGRELMQAAIESAKALGIARLFALTYEAEFFQRMGFRVVEKDALPAKVWRDCIYCPKADACDEIAVLRELDQGRAEDNAVG